MAPGTGAVVTRVQQLRDEVRRHKKTIDTHRKLLRASAAELDALEQKCQALGIALVITAPAGAGDIHGPVDDHSHS